MDRFFTTFLDYQGDGTFRHPTASDIIVPGVWARRDGLWEIYTDHYPEGNASLFDVQVRGVHQILTKYGMFWFAEEILIT